MDHYLPHTEDDIKEMLFKIGVKDFSELLSTIPKETLLKTPLDLPPALSEAEALTHLKKISYLNRSDECYTCFMGGGAYDHFVPAAVDAILSRSEFYTAYTPYLKVFSLKRYVIVLNIPFPLNLPFHFL